MPVKEPAPRRCPQCDEVMTVGRLLGDRKPLRYATIDDAVDLSSLCIQTVGHHGPGISPPFVFTHRCRPCGLVLIIESENDARPDEP